MSKVRIIVFAAIWLLMPAALSALSIDWKNIPFKDGPHVGGDLAGSSDLSVVDLEELVDRNVAIFNQHHPAAITLVSHADSRECSIVDCVKLSCDRAILVYSYLIGRGLQRNRIKSVVCAGSSSPVTAGETEADRQLNRRVEFVLNGQ